MYTTGDYYDGVGTWCLSDNDFLNYGGDVWIPVDELVAKYAPNYTYALDNFPDLRATMTAPDGHIYGFPIAAKQPDCAWIMHINHTWLDNLGLEEPTTLEEFEAVLRAFKEGDANGNGDPNDEIPLSFFDDGVQFIYGSLFGSWGVLDDRNTHLMIKDGEVVFTPTTDGYKEGIKWLQRMYAEGLIDQEAFTQDSTMYSAKGRGGDDAIYGVLIEFTGVNGVGIERYQEEYRSLPPMEGPNGDRLWGQGDASIFRNMFGISSQCENPEVLVRWLDGLFETEMSLYISNGPPEFYDKGDDGIFRLKELPEGMTSGDVRNNYTVTAMPYCITEETQNTLMELSETDIIKKEADARVSPYLTQEPFPTVWRTPEQNERLTEISADIVKLANNKRVAWITGQADIDQEWEQYVTDLQNIHLEEYVQIYQDAVDTYNANIQ